ncbi:methyl-CpG-binding domain protein 5 isoform X2 [Esox lucius]|uniref:methyl-CpG-binding domain protein 5 isoform X2 n=1 Tax=Esox lucius TaxID=8010 RepID=UPI00147738E9|nr:methyl-CpG-binding domain protein 5 isoform X2 [Esox lucius]
MNGGKDCEGGGVAVEGVGAEHTTTVQVPIGWQRKVDPKNGVFYISPSGLLLSCLDQVKRYLLTDGTCKCGLECPLILPKVFNFDPGAAVKQRTAEDVRADENVTKLCIHKRKLLAVATLHRSLELPHPALTLSSSAGGTSSTAVLSSHSTNQRAIRNKSQESLLPGSVAPDCKIPFKMMMMVGPRRYPQDQGGPAQELYHGYAQRPHRLSGEPGPRSPYRSGYGVMLSPSSQIYGPGDGSPLSPSPRTDPLGSPDGFRSNPCGFPGASSSSPIHGGNRTPLSPPGMLHHGHGSPAGAQLPCAMVGRTSTPLSPTATAKSPVVMMKKPMCNFPGQPGMDIPIRAPFNPKTQPGAPHPGPPPALPPSCAIQKKQMTSEKDPLGILDPIPSKPSVSVGQNFQPSIHSSQVPMMNVTVNNHPPPAIVPLPSNLPLPTVKSGLVGHGHVQRTQQTSVASSMPPSPVTSPVHMAGPVLSSRVEASPQRSRTSSTSSDHGSFAMPSGPSQGLCGGMKAPPRSPLSSMGSPRPAMPSNMPSSPSSAKPDSHTLHQYKDLPSQLLVGIGNQNAISTQHNSPGVYPSATSSGSSVSAPPPAPNQKAQHPGLLGMPLNQILDQQNAASFPASTLLSAAAKAQLANQNKHGGDSGDPAGRGCAMDSNAGGGVGGGLPAGPLGGVGGTRGAADRPGSGTLNPMLPPNSAMLMPTATEASVGGQSGRAALRDKLMAQQRDRGEPVVRKRKQPTAPAPLNSSVLIHHDGMVFNMLSKPSNAGGPVPRLPPPSSAEQLRKVARLGGLTPNTSMAQLLQSMSNQNRHALPAGPVGPGHMHYGDGGASQQNMLAQQRMLSQVEGQGMRCQGMDAGGHGAPRPHAPQFPGLMNHIQANSLGACGPLGPGGQVGPGLGNMPLSHHPGALPPPLSHPPHPSQHHQQHNHLHATLGRTNMSAMTLSNNDGSCGQAASEPAGDSSTAVNCSMGSMVSLQPHIIDNSSSGAGGGTQVFQHHHAQQQLHQGMQQVMQGLPGPGYQGSSQQPGFPENSFPDNSSSSNPMAGLFQNFQGCLPDTNISVPRLKMSSQSGMMSLPESQGMLSHSQFGDSQREMQQTQGAGLTPGMHVPDRLPGVEVESIDAIYRAVVDAASKGMHVVITTTVSGTTQSSPVPALSAMSAFTNSIGEPVSVNHNLQHSQAAVTHSGHRGAHQEGEQTLSQQSRPRQARAGRPRKNSGQGKGNVSIPEVQGALAEAPHQDYYRSPGHGVPRVQWEAEVTGQPAGPDGGHPVWAGEEFLECSTHVRSSPCMERPGSLAPAPPCPTDGAPREGHHHHALAVATEQAYLEEGFSRFGSTCNRTSANVVNYKDRLEQTVERCAHMNGGSLPQVQFSLRGYGDPLGPPRQGDLTGDDQSPSSSTSLEGSLAREYVGHYNGHFNGGSAPSPSDTKSLSSEEDLRHPDSPSSEMLHYRPRTFNMGDLVWGQGFKGFPSWPGKLAGEEAVLNRRGAGVQLREQGKVEPETLKTLTHDLEALDRATKRNRKAGKLNNHLEAAIHEAMSELDKMSGTVHQIPSRDRQVKLPKPKRRKISR